MFGPSGMWLNEDACAGLSAAAREKRIQHLTLLLEQGEYGRHLCAGLAEASGLKDKRLLPGLIKVAGYHRTDRDYDCRPKWMAVAALARQESDEAVPLLVSLVDHGNQNTRQWARSFVAEDGPGLPAGQAGLGQMVAVPGKQPHRRQVPATLGDAAAGQGVMPRAAARDAATACRSPFGVCTLARQRTSLLLLEAICHLALCLSREEPRQFYLERGQNVRLARAADFLMPVAMCR